MTLKRMDNVGIVVESLDTAITFFSELGLKLEGCAIIEGEWAGRVTGLGSQRVEIAMMVMPHDPWTVDNVSPEFLARFADALTTLPENHLPADDPRGDG